MYKGESFNFILKGNTGYDLTTTDFSVYVYPDGCPSPEFKKDKDECEAKADGSYICSFAPDETAQMVSASYTVEVRDITNNIIYVKPHAFPLVESATGLDLIDDDDDE